MANKTKYTHVIFGNVAPIRVSRPSYSYKPFEKQHAAISASCHKLSSSLYRYHGDGLCPSLILDITISQVICEIAELGFVTKCYEVPYCVVVDNDKLNSELIDIGGAEKRLEATLSKISCASLQEQEKVELQAALDALVTELARLAAFYGITNLVKGIAICQESIRQETMEELRKLCRELMAVSHEVDDLGECYSNELDERAAWLGVSQF